MDYNDYFQTLEDYFWEWVDAGEVIAMPNGVTIAYRDYVREVLDHLKDQGFPPFGSLLLALVATNPNGSHVLQNDFDALGTRLRAKHVSAATLAQMERAMPFLKTLARVPNEYKQGMKRILLLQTIFRDCHNRVSAKNSAKFITALDRGTEKRFWYKQPFNEKHFYKEFKAVFLLGEKFPTVDALIQAMAGMPSVKVPDFLEEDEQEVATESPKDFVDQLLENESTFHVGALIRRIWSGLNIPFHNVLPSEQPLGGVSDISNKGDFDKLLISEFAYDDLTFVSRLANNEALYINREIPPASNPMRRMILIDVSLKNWGSSKTIAYALMLAIAKHPKTDLECLAFVLGNRFYPVLYENIHTLIDSLQLLDGGLDSSEGLELFFKEHGNDKNIEVFYLSSFDAVKTPRMQQVMAEYHSRIKYWIHADSQGHVSIYRNRHSSKTHIQDMWLPLEELWTRKTKPAMTEDRKPTELPTPMVSDYPILFARAENIKAKLLTPDGETFLLTANKTLLHFADKNAEHYSKGFNLVYEPLPFPHGEYAMGKMPNGDYVLLAFNMSKRELYVINITTGEQQQTKFRNWKSYPYPRFVFYRDAFYYRTSHYQFSISVSPKLKVKLLDVPIPELADVYAKLEEEQSKLWFSHSNVLKNITDVYINKKGNLVLNAKHELQLGSSSIHFGSASPEGKEFTSQLSKSQYRFRDGSTVTAHPDGMLILRSANENIPEIYVPTCMNMQLGLAANHEFAGNEYFYKSGKSRVQAPAFWKFYMERFLDNIIYHGTDTKTAS